MEAIITNISALGTLLGAIAALTISAVNFKQLRTVNEIQTANNLLSVYVIDKDLADKAKHLSQVSEMPDEYNIDEIRVEAAEKYLNSFEILAVNIILNNSPDRYFRPYLEPQIREIVGIFNKHRPLRKTLSQYKYTVQLFERWKFNILPYDKESSQITRRFSESPFFFL